MKARIQEILIRHYKSIGQCRIKLGNISILVGPNGVGKSNFIDAIKFVQEAVSNGLEYPIRQRGGIDSVRRRSAGHPTHFGIRLNITLSDGATASFAFEVGAQPNGSYIVQAEKVAILHPDKSESYYEVRKGDIVNISADLEVSPKITSDRLLIVSLSGVERLRPLFDHLSKMQAYNVNPAAIRQLQPHEIGDVLAYDGKNVASVFRRMKENNPEATGRIEQYLRAVNSMIEGVDYKAFGPQETLEFRQFVQTARPPWRFTANSMSDGTLRSIGTLIALFQFDRDGRVPSVVMLEEPEITIHPGAAGILMDAIFEASNSTQIIATTHSPDLLDHRRLSIDNIKVVRSVNGETGILNADAASADAVRQQLYTPGELLRSRQLIGDARSRQQVRQLELFQ